MVIKRSSDRLWDMVWVVIWSLLSLRLAVLLGADNPKYWLRAFRSTARCKYSLPDSRTWGDYLFSIKIPMVYCGVHLPFG